MVAAIKVYALVIVQSFSCVWVFESLWTAAHQASLSFNISLNLLEIMSIESVMPFNHLLLCCSLLPSTFSSTRGFSNESTLCKVLELQLQPQSFPWIFRVDFLVWFDLLAVQGTLKSLLQQHSSEAPLWRSASLMVQLSHPYVTTGKTTALTRQTCVSKVMSLLCNMLSMLVITFLPKSKCFLISWLQWPSAVILEPKKIKSDSFHCFPIYLPWNDRTRCHDLSFLNVEL